MLAVVGLVLVARLRSPGAWTRILNLFSIVLVLLPDGRDPPDQAAVPPSRNAGRTAWPVTPGQAGRPDIYYIILDGYARSDVMQRPLRLRQLPVPGTAADQGFFVAHGSTANYCQTPLSLSSSLNFDYLDDLVKELGTDLTALRELIGENDLAATLGPWATRSSRSRPGFEPTDLTDADLLPLAVSPVHRVPPAPDRPDAALAFLFTGGDRDLFAQARDRTLFALDRLAAVADDPRPTLTFAHFVCPHPPFLFGENGEDMSRRDKRFFSTTASSSRRSACRPMTTSGGIGSRPSTSPGGSSRSSPRSSRGRRSRRS